MYVCMYVYIYMDIYGAPHVPTFCGVPDLLSLFKGVTGEHYLVEHCLVLVGEYDSGPVKGIGSNTRVLDPIPSRIEDRRLKMQGKVSGASSIFNLRSRQVLDPIPGYGIQ